MRKFIAILTIALWANCATGASPRWESTDAPIGMELISDQKGDSNVVEMTVKDGYIYISATQPLTVKVFSILGQLINQETLPSGIHRLRMTTRGVYILKAGPTTRRVTI